MKMNGRKTDNMQEESVNTLFSKSMTTNVDRRISGVCAHWRNLVDETGKRNRDPSLTNKSP